MLKFETAAGAGRQSDGCQSAEVVGKSAEREVFELEGFRLAVAEVDSLGVCGRVTFVLVCAATTFFNRSISEPTRSLD